MKVLNKHHKKISLRTKLEIIPLPYFLALAIILSASCKKFVDVSLPVNQVTSYNVFSNDATATSAVVGIYARMMSNNLYFSNGAMTLYPALSSDELFRTSPDADVNPFYDNAIPSTSSIIQNDIWRNAYQIIYQVNYCLQGLANSTGVSNETKQQLTGELKFTRAFVYFYLINLFGNVPLELTTDYIENESIRRTPVAEVYDQIIADLKDAENFLNESYVSNEHIRPNKWAASALLARVYLYQGDWNLAELESTAVISSGTYSLLSDLSAIFLANSTETIWQLYPVQPNMNTADAETFIIANNQKPIYALTDWLVSSFEKNDKRKIYWLDSIVVNNKPYYFPFKYKIKNSDPKVEYNIVLRLAEIYLIRAEARVKQNNLSGAIEDVNAIRNRAGLNSLTTLLNKEQCLNAIIQERRIEFFAEWGHRWFDLKRINAADSVLGKEKLSWNPTAALYPIPFNELQLNQNLIQNPGY